MSNLNPVLRPDMLHHISQNINAMILGIPRCDMNRIARLLDCQPSEVPAKLKGHVWPDDQKDELAQALGFKSTAAFLRVLHRGMKDTTYTFEPRRDYRDWGREPQ